MASTAKRGGATAALLWRIDGQTLGIVGFGNIGRELAEKAVALGLKVLATGRTGKDSSQLPVGVSWCDGLWPNSAC